MNSRFVVGLAAAALAGGLWGSVLRAQAGASASSGIYTADQAKRGQAIYVESCAQCHLDDLTGGTSPPLVGTDFLGAWKDKTVGALFEQLRMTMPFDNPGGLMPAQYADVLAYMLSANKFATGDKELASDEALLRQITLDAAK